MPAVQQPLESTQRQVAATEGLRVSLPKGHQKDSHKGLAVGKKKPGWLANNLFFFFRANLLGQVFLLYVRLAPEKHAARSGCIFLNTAVNCTGSKQTARSDRPGLWPDTKQVIGTPSQSI